MTSPQVAQHPASVDAYLRHGWQLVPIPPGTKGPTQTGWNRRENTLMSSAHLPPGWGIGLAHAYSGTMAVDVDVWDRAAFELMMHGINLQALYDAPDAVVIDSGRQGHGKLLYAMPFGLSLPNKKFIDTDTEGKRYNYLDLRCGTANGLTVQDVLPPSIHPDTNQPYRWAGRGHWTRLPVIPQPLLDFWVKSMQRDTAPQVDAPISADWDEIRDALVHISPDCSRDEWITVGMALHHAGASSGNVEYALQLWDQWSQPSSKYPGPGGVETQWRSFRNDKATKVRLPSLFRLARQSGWEKPAPDASALFQGVVPVAPAQLTANLRPAPPQLDMDLVPTALRSYAEKVSVSIGCDPMIPLFAGIAAVSGAVDARTRLELKPGFKVPPVIWCMTIGEPAGKKTHGATPMFSVLHKLQREDVPRYKQAMQVFEAMEARHEMARKAFLDAAKDTDALLSGEVPQGYGDAPVKPVPLEIVIDRTTSSKLVRMAVDTQRGLLAKMDEMRGWMRDMTDARSVEDRSAWTQSFEAGWYRMDRVGAGTISCDNFAISIYGNIQPAAFSQYYESMAEDGMLQRFIPVMVHSELSHKGKPDGDTSAQTAYEMMIRLAFGMPAMTYRLSAPAARVYDEFQDWYYVRLSDERLLRPGEIFMTAFGKIEGLVGRIALLWHMMTEPMAVEVSADTMQRAVEVVRGFVIPSLRYVYEGEIGGFDQWCADYVIQYADQSTLSLSQIRRSARRQLEGLSHWAQMDKVIGAMLTLEQSKWVSRIDDQKKPDSAQWMINPAIAEQFKDHRKRLIEAKQRQMDEIYKLSRKEKPKVHGYEDAA